MMTEKRFSLNSMGRIKAKALPSFLEKPWLPIDWEDRETDLQFINDYRPKGSHRQLRILLHGPVGAGKSSFINSVFSALEGRICHKATACNIIQNSFTKKYITYKIKRGDQETAYPFVLNDMTGLSNISWKHRRVHEKDMKMAMMGHIKDEYKFHPQSALSETDPFFNRNPTINDKAHILVTVFDANTINQLDQNIAETIQEIRDEATELGIPHVAILSKIDEACPEIREDIKNVCHSRTLQQKIQLLSKLVGIPENCIFPIKNYHCEKKLNHETDALILNTLRSLIEIGEEYLSNGKRSNVLGGTVRKSIQDIRIRKKTAKLGIHHVADLTKTDDTCSEISNETNVCRSQELQGDVQDLSPESCVYPEKNYDCEKSQSEPDEDVASREKRCWLLKERTGSRLSRTHLHWERPSKDWQGNWVRQQQLSDVQKKTKTDGNLPEPQTDSGVNMRINLILRRSADHSD
ncbi:PREDICTED: interferon-induced protein 44-like isoform X1 [Poecilia mexicana]|uniref:interferon-induced protein 44-like isoform X1 n=1 Tax=Poecilia mexicana TaxID=48701 RepID=UPI00072EDAB4|nr:PREDICTED: interferon-induced protein 44-like isoform X1 [Poecilia mexicana]